MIPLTTAKTFDLDRDVHGRADLLHVVVRKNHASRGLHVRGEDDVGAGEQRGIVGALKELLKILSADDLAQGLDGGS